VRELVPTIARCNWQAALVSDADWKAVVRSVDGYRTREPVQRAELDQAEATLHVALPEMLRDLYLATDGVVDEPGQWFVIWPIVELVTRNAAAYAAEGDRRRALVGFGDDGTGSPFCVRSGGGDAVLSWSAIDQQATHLADDLVSFWTGWITGTLPPH